ncbi:MAG: glutathione peroxidase [Gammaproteobacteria bacterium]
MVKKLLLMITVLVSFQVSAKECSPLLDFDVRSLNEKTEVNLCEAYQGKVLLIVNTASRCAYTDQYESLEKLYDQYKDDGLVVLGFPSNDFGQQEPGNEYQIKTFCRTTYGVRFPMFAKTRVSERYADPLYQQLASAAGTYPKWNFHKYLIDRNGELVASYRSGVDPLDQSIVSEIRNQIRKF